MWKGIYSLGLILGAAMVCTAIDVVLVTTFTDMAGILLFLGLATALMEWLT